MEQHIKCPRCNSLDTKFCYNNNYSEKQPQYLCRTCERHWTLGGSLNNISIGGSSRPCKVKRTKSFSASSTSAAAPLPQLLSQVGVQNQLVSPSLNPMSQTFNQSMNCGAVNDVDSFNQLVSSLPISFTYNQGSGGGVGASYFSTLLDGQLLNPSSDVPFNQPLNCSSVNVVGTTSFSSSTFAMPQSLVQSLMDNPSLHPIPQPFNELVSPSLPITITYHYGGAGGGAQADYLYSHAEVQSLNPSSETFNQPLNNVVGSSNLALLSGFNAVDSHASNSQHEIESLYQGLIEPSVADNNLVPATYYRSRWPQSIINTDNNVVSEDISQRTIFDITSNINDNSDQNTFMPNYGYGVPVYGAPPQY